MVFGSFKKKDKMEQDERYKLDHSNMNDPILKAVNEAEPFEQAADRTQRKHSYVSLESNNDLKDVFGNPVGQQDISNPTRARNERPLDTIRAFEYSITGDMAYRDQLETGRLGWGFHEDFPYYNLNALNQYPYEGAERPTINLNTGADQAVYLPENFSSPPPKPEKKKKGFFRRKK